MSAPIVFFDIAGPDVEGLKAFYKAVFDWDSNPMGQLSVPVAPSPLKGTFRADPPETMIYLGVPDITATLEKVVAHGGSIHAPRFEVPGVVVLGLFCNPAGTRMGLVEMDGDKARIPGSCKPALNLCALTLPLNRIEGSPVDIDVVRPRELTSEEIARWTALQETHADLESPFLSAQWPRAVEQAQTTELSAVRVAILHENGTIKGFMPAKVQGGAAMPAGAPMCDYQGVIAEPGAAIELRRIVEAMGVGRFDFSHMPQSQAAFAPHLRGVTPSWITRLPFGYEVYAAEKTQESGVLKDLDKRRRKAEREMGPVTFTAFSRSRSDFDQMLEWKRGQYRATGQTDIFGTGWTARLLRNLFAGRDPEFGGSLFTLHIGDTLAAAQFHLMGKRVIHAWMIAHDDSFERVSPGLLLFQDIMRWMDDTPFTSIDYGPGDYRFKKQLSNAACMVGHGFVGRPGASTLMRTAAYGVRGIAERLPLGKVSELPAKAMRRMDLIRGLR